MIHPRTVLVATLVFATAACSRPGSDQDAFRWTNELPAGAVVHLRDGTGDITVTRSAGQSVRVTGSRSWRRGRASDIQFVVNQRGNDYYVCAMWSGSGKCGNGGYRGAQTNSLLSMFSLFHRRSDASAAFVAEIPANVIVDARTTNGSVQIDGVSAGVMAKTTNGTIRATNVSGSLNLATTNGDVRVSAESLASSDSVRLSSSNGSIHAELPADLQGNFDVSTMNGSVRSDFALPHSANSRGERRFQGQIGTSTRLVRMRTLNGEIILTTRTAPATNH